MLGTARQQSGGPRCALVWRDIGGYHAARSHVANRIPNLHVDTIEVLESAVFAEFRAEVSGTSPFPRHELKLAPPMRAPSVRGPLHALLDRLSPDVVFAPGWSMLEALLAIEWCALKSVPLVIMSESTRHDATRSPAKEQVKRRIVGLAAAALVGGGPQADYVVDLGMPRDRVFLGYDIVDNDHFAANAARVREQAPALRARHRLPERYFLCCARLVAKKNVPRLIEAVAAYRAAAGSDAWELIVVGPGPLQAEIEETIAARGLGDAVHLVGARGYAELPVYYGLASAFILPSTIDQWGLVVNEAMASGLPVLVSKRCGCTHDLVQEGRNGFTFDPYDIGAMADAMRRIASDDCDRAAMGAASRAIVAEWGPDRFVAGFEAAAWTAIEAPKTHVSVADRLLLRALTWR